jgi:hypothetical protein
VCRAFSIDSDANTNANAMFNTNTIPLITTPHLKPPTLGLLLCRKPKAPFSTLSSSVALPLPTDYGFGHSGLAGGPNTGFRRR